MQKLAHRRLVIVDKSFRGMHRRLVQFCIIVPRYHLRRREACMSLAKIAFFLALVFVAAALERQYRIPRIRLIPHQHGPTHRVLRIAVREGLQ